MPGPTTDHASAQTYCASVNMMEAGFKTMADLEEIFSTIATLRI